MESYCVRAFAEALEVIPYTLAENAGLNPIEMVTELRNKHARGETAAGINVRKGQITDMMDENVVQPLLVTTSAITLACECVRMILKVSWCLIAFDCQGFLFGIMSLEVYTVACREALSVAGACILAVDMLLFYMAGHAYYSAAVY